MSEEEQPQPVKKKRGRPRKPFIITGEIVQEHELGPNLHHPNRHLTPEQEAQQFADALVRVIRRQIERERLEQLEGRGMPPKDPHPS
jgi:hypothetical protein